MPVQTIEEFCDTLHEIPPVMRRAKKIYLTYKTPEEIRRQSSCSHRKMTARDKELHDAAMLTAYMYARHVRYYCGKQKD